MNGKQPVPVSETGEWGQWFENADNRRVAFDTVAGGVQVSTVFIGLDHNFGDGPPLLFETLVTGGALDGEMERYSTWDEAERGHQAMLERIRGIAE